MRIPQRPPEWMPILAEMVPDRYPLIWKAASEPPFRGKYLHWDELRHLKVPDGLTHRELWAGIKGQRLGFRKAIPLRDVQGRHFTYLLPDPIPEQLHVIDRGAGGTLELPEQITNADTRDRYVVHSLIEEAITSSQLEGAVTTRRVAENMLREGRRARDRDEQMILNNYQTMQRIRSLKVERLTPDIIFQLHRLVTEDTLDDPSGAGRLRRDAERVHVADQYDEVYFVPPPADELPKRLEAMCRFANDGSEHEFIHPVIRSIALHFWLAYDHPFVDGNGRCARALFYWSMLHHGFWLCEFISISRVILKARSAYYTAFLHTETDENDLTYFLLYHTKVLQSAVDQLHHYIKVKVDELRRLETELRGMEVLNHRQRAIISHALRHPSHRYTIESHRSSHNVVYQTARSDLLDLERRKLLRGYKVGKTWQFQPQSDLVERLAKKR
jgi:Fic family protein